MVAFLYRIPAGIPGDVNRSFGARVEAINVTPFGTTGAPTAYGVPMVVDQTGGNVGNARTVQAADTAALIYGILVRPYPSQSLPVVTAGTGLYNDPFGAGVPPAKGPVDVLRAGYISVLLSGSTAAAKGAPVYIWTAAPSGQHITGGFEATNPSTNGIALNNTYFMGPADANGNTEIMFNL